MAMGARPQEMKKLGEEVLRACRASVAAEKVADSATTMGKAYSRYSGGRCCYNIPVVWNTGFSKSIILEDAVRGLGVHIEELGQSLNIISASGDTLSIIGTADIFITTQVTGPGKKLPQCCVLRGNKQSPEISIS